MKYLFLGIIAIALGFQLSAFKYSTTNPIVGTYGIRDESTPSVQLQLRSNNTFHYLDRNLNVDVEGVWKLSGKKVILEEGISSKSYHHIWTFSKNSQVAHSRMGMNFYRLCKIN